MNELLLTNARVVLERGIQEGGVLIREGRIAHVFADRGAPVGLGAGNTIDLGGALLAPGLIDIHIHGSAGVDAMDADGDGLAKLSGFLLAEGITGYFATLVPTDERGYREAVDEIDSYIERQIPPSEPIKGIGRARVLGIHFEGPFVSHHKCGALRREYFRTYDDDPRSVELFSHHKGHDSQPTSPRLMTLAPEVRGGLDLTRELTGRGVGVFIGHTQADPEALDRAAEAGSRHITHFPNALDALHHRKPGAVAWGLVRGHITVDCIADFQHVHPLMLQLIYQSKGADRMALISDAVLPTGLGDGEFTVWGEKIAVRAGRTSLTRGPATGTIAGSVITLREALANIMSLDVPVWEAFRMASLVPARAAGLEREHGSIDEGKRADLIVCDEKLRVGLAFVGGALALDKR